MDFETYERTGRTNYEGLAAVVATILEAALGRHPSLHAQQIQHRAKDSGSLLRKLAKTPMIDGGEIEPFAKDLAGARLIFYTNSDVSRFLSSGIMSDNFEVNWDRTKIHHPTSDDPEASELFVSNNYVVRLKDDRAALPEYARFAGLECEVQVQTTLNHAWAEMAHDTIYKKPEIEGFGGDLMKGIEARMKSIMRKYLAPAGYEFQKVLSDFERLSSGKELFEKGIISALGDCADNNELRETLEKFSNYVLPHYDDHEAVAGDILDAVAAAVKRARETPVRAIDTPFGTLGGYTSDTIASLGASIIGQLQYVNIDKTFDVICDLYVGATNDADQAHWVGLADSIADHDLRIWQQAGPVVQGMMVDRIRALSDQDKVTLRPLVLTMLQKILSAEISGASSTSFDTVTFHRGAVRASDELRRIRDRALAVLGFYYAAAQDDDERAEIVNAYSVAMTVPHVQGSPDPNLAALIYEDAAAIIQLYARSLDAWSFELRQKVEHKLLWKHRHYGTAPPADLTNEMAEAGRCKLADAILAFRERVNADDGFTTYKLLVGFESVFPPAWEDREFNYDEEEAYRAEHIDNVIAKINSDNADAWLAIIQRCAATQSNDGATFPTFAKFLEKLGAAQPEILIGYLPRLGDRLANFLPPMLRGLGATDRWPQTEAMVRGWITERRHLSDIAWSFGSVEKLDFALIAKTLQSAIAAADDSAVLSIINSIVVLDRSNPGERLKAPFLAATGYMAEKGITYWVNAWWSGKGGSPLLALLDGQEISAILTSLVSHPTVTNPLDRLLADVARHHPEAVLDYLGQRLRRDRAERQAGYEAIPYDLGSLKKVMQKHPGLVLSAARGWFDERPESFEYYGGRLVSVVFPGFSDELEASLKAHVVTGDLKEIAFVLAVLRSYSGQAFLQPLCREIVAALPADDPQLSRVEIILESMGVVGGEFGRVIALKQKRDEIASWADDARPAVQVFAARFTHSLDSLIASEQRRSEESLALRRLEYDDPDTTRD